MPTTWIAVPDAALQLRRSYNQILRLLLIGHLRGERRGGRWVVCGEDAVRLAEDIATTRPKVNRSTDT